MDSQLILGLQLLFVQLMDWELSVQTHSKKKKRLKDTCQSSMVVSILFCQNRSVNTSLHGIWRSLESFDCNWPTHEIDGVIYWLSDSNFDCNWPTHEIDGVNLSDTLQCLNQCIALVNSILPFNAICYCHHRVTNVIATCALQCVWSD
jgi:hypothetical protein